METFNKFLKKELNTPQRKAVTQQDGAQLVVAGAGSGKTRVITARMANLILNHQASPSTILALTFTNKAAGEMKHRLASFLGPTTKLPFVGTFHAYCLLILRSNPTLLPFTDFSIIDEDDQKTLLKKILKKNNLEKQVSITQLKYQISKAKNKLEPDEELHCNPYFKELFLAYETEKASSHCLDFDDLLLTVLKIFQKNSSFKKSFQSRVKHILIDEYQDTNGVQHELLREMALASKEFVLDSLCAVGDEDQSIYSWRGARVTNMLSFQQDFAPVKVIKIEQNYRSVQPILQAANSVIEHNRQRHPKQLWSDKKAKNRILLVSCQSGYQEADAMTSYLKTLPKQQKLREVAILYRTHFQSRSIEESLIRNSIPYIIVGGIRFYERKEIKDLLAYLRLLVNPFDRTSLFRIINRPARGLGAKFEEQLYTEWNNNPMLNFHQILQFLLDNPEQSTKGTKALSVKKFLKIFDGLEKEKKPSAILSEVLERSEYLSYLRHAYDLNEAETKIENIQELAQSLETFEKKESTLEDFLHEIALLQEKLEIDKDKTDHVQMMTLHAAKGLEFNTVMIAGLEEGLLPSARSLSSDEALEEERRLFYVGMTRAMERLVLLRATYRNSYGQVSDQVISRFLTEVPEKFFHHLDLTNVHPAKTKSLIADWLGSKIESTVTTFGFSPKPQKKAVSLTGPWKKNQPVIHKKFGAGVIKKVEKTSKDEFHLTVLFRVGEKKLLSSFVSRV
ncbi:UvrD-helicase domain-containing protein [Candidatus Dependentiae bacterium]|nr:UvrD-helicase domain-containing protein [Candidatus Dependentiae bacterium]